MKDEKGVKITTELATTAPMVISYEPMVIAYKKIMMIMINDDKDKPDSIEELKTSYIKYTKND